MVVVVLHDAVAESDVVFVVVRVVIVGVMYEQC